MSENQKKIFSLTLAGIITLIIVGIWFSFSGSSSGQASAESQDMLSSVSPWQAIKNDFSQAFSGFNSQMSSTTESSSTIPVEVVTDDTATNTASSTDKIISTTTSTTSIKN